MQGIEDQHRDKQNLNHQEPKQETKSVPDMQEQMMFFMKAVFGKTVELVDGKPVLNERPVFEPAANENECGFETCRPPYRKFSESENRMIPCGCRKSKEFEIFERKQKIRQLGIPEIYIGCTFSDIRTAGEPGEFASMENAMELSKKMIESYQKTRGSGILFTGQKGTGKTMLCSIILQEIYLQYNANVYFINFDKYIDTVRESMNKGNRNSGREFELQERLFRADLLCIDEIGVGTMSEHKLQKLYAVINERYERRRPTIITTNIPMAKIAGWEYGRIHSRLMEYYYIVEMQGDDYRLKYKRKSA